MSRTTASKKKTIKKPSTVKVKNQQVRPSSGLNSRKQKSSKPSKGTDRKTVETKSKFSSTPGIQNNKMTIIKNEYEEKLRLIREKRQQLLERYSSPKTKEIYVNPNRRKRYKIHERSEPVSSANSKLEKMVKNMMPPSKARSSATPVCASSSPKLLRKSCLNASTSVKAKGKIDPVKVFEKVTSQYTIADEILSQAHRLIWLWLFNGLFPSSLRKKPNIKQEN
ncbi:uncharacterized protein LOC135143845 [Zophobas morio]|uniref:uncharacterized protein LOC135143845 n=1 Tax=Zophobas morio TaxID=2755281 RepID=UPI003082EF07